jgi:hypothetical protein
MRWSRILTTWVFLAIAMSLNGIFREAVLKRAMAGSAADAVSALLGAAIILLVTRPMFRPLRGSPDRVLAMTSLVLVVLTVVFEFAVGLYVDHKSWTELLDNYAVWRGRLWPILLALVALTPFVWGRWFTGEGARPHDHPP